MRDRNRALGRPHRPGRRVHDAIAETRHLTSWTYDWVVEGDIKACFDEISHPALLGRLRERVGDKRVLALVKAFLKAGILGEDGQLRDSDTGAPQGSILSPLLSNLALSVLDEHIAQHPGGPNSTNVERRKRKRHGKANIRLVRYADDWVALVSGTREHAEDIRTQMATVLTPMGLRLSQEKTTITHIDDGLDFLGWRIQRHRKPGTDRSYVYTYPSKKALRSIARKVKTLCRQTSTNLPLPDLLARLNPVLAGWCVHFRPGVSSKTFHYLAHFTWWQVIRWLRRKHPRITWKDLRRRYCAGGWWPTTPRWALYDPARVTTTRYRYRGAAIPTPWPVKG